MLPRRGLVDGDNIEVGHQDDWPVGTAPGPAQEQSVPLDPGQAELVVKERELGPLHVVKGFERRGVDREGSV